MSLAGFSCSLLSVTGGFVFFCMLFVVVVALCLFVFLLTFTAQKSSSVPDSVSCSCAPGRGHSNFELNNQILLVSSLLPETKDASRLKGSHFICLTRFFSFATIWSNCWNRDIVAGRVTQLSRAKANFKWFFLYPWRNDSFILRLDQGASL